MSENKRFAVLRLRDALRSDALTVANRIETCSLATMDRLEARSIQLAERAGDLEPLAEVAEAVEALQSVISTLEAQNRALLQRVETLEACLRDARAANEARASETGVLAFRLSRLPDMARLVGRVDALEGKHDAIGKSLYEGGITVAERLNKLEAGMTRHQRWLEQDEERRAGAQSCNGSGKRREEIEA